MITAADLAQGDVNGDGIHDTTDEDFVNALLVIPGREGANARHLPASKARGDYMDDEIINSTFDYALWKMTFGNTPPEDMRADGNLNDIVGAADYNVYRDRLGQRSAWYTGPLPGVSGVINGACSGDSSVNT